MKQLRNNMYLALCSLFCSLMAGNQLFAQTPCEIAKILEVDLVNGAKFGGAVAIDGDTAIVGASHFDIPFIDPGKAFVFRFDGINWLLEQTLVASDGIDSDRFGHSVAIDGDIAVVGARWGSPNLNGSAYIFHFDGKNWIEQQKLFDDTEGELESFGDAVAIIDETVFIGVPGDNSGAGSTFVYTFDGLNWVLHQVLHASDTDQNLGRQFGNSVSVSGNVVLVAAKWDNELGSSAGAVYVFRFDGTNWIEEQKLLPSIGIAEDFFGKSVSLSASVAVIGTQQSEAAYIFNFDGANWNQEQIISVFNGDPSQDFGRSVAISGNVIVVGAGEDEENGMDAGAAYLFRFDGKSWQEEQKLLPEDGAVGDRFGMAVAISGETSLIGAPYDDNQGVRIGSAYVFTGLAGIDCNLNGVSDGCDIFAGGSKDENGNDIPDECEDAPCPWDLNGNTIVGTSDLLALFAQWGTDGPADFDGNGVVNTADLLILFANWGPCP